MTARDRSARGERSHRSCEALHISWGIASVSSFDARIAASLNRETKARPRNFRKETGIRLPNIFRGDCKNDYAKNFSRYCLHLDRPRPSSDVCTKLLRRLRSRCYGVPVVAVRDPIFGQKENPPTFGSSSETLETEGWYRDWGLRFNRRRWPTGR